jgi:hypothetical protein
LKPKKPDSRLTTLQLAITAARKQDKIEKLEKQINMYRSQLTLRFLAYMNEKAELDASKWDTNFNKLSEDGNRIMEIVAFTKEQMFSQHSEVISAIMKLSNGETMSLTDSGFEEELNVPDDIRPDHVVMLQSNATGQGGLASLAGIDNIKDGVLRLLAFRHMRDRYETIKDRHRKTFEWLFNPPDVDALWSSFPDWLNSDGPCYWVNGKAGSGKSTLMRFILKDNRTKQYLESWAGRYNLKMASFFFWNLGPFSLQKSQAGLLRALLRSILEQVPNLIPVVMPDLVIEAAKSARALQASEPTLEELKRWFRRLIRQTSKSFRICFIVDGLDEYVGDVEELISLFLPDNRSKYVKFILSSRPVISCEIALSKYPRIMLQDLTRNDIRKYTEDSFIKTFEEIGDSLESDLPVLVEEVASRSSGVFLWVILVVKSLERGFKNGDGIEELLLILNQLPKELAELYEKLLRSIPNQYQRQACMYINIMHQSIKYEQQYQDSEEPDYPITALQLSLIEELKNPAQLDKLRIKPLSKEGIAKKSSLIDRRIRSRCCGLLETRPRVVTAFKPSMVAPPPTDSAAFDIRCFGPTALNTPGQGGLPVKQLGAIPATRTELQQSMIEDNQKFLRDMVQNELRSPGRYKSQYLPEVASAQQTIEPLTLPKMPSLDNEGIYFDTGELCIDFIHRSVVEFLCESESRLGDLLRPGQKVTDPRLSLFASHLCFLKSLHTTVGIGNYSMDGHRLLKTLNLALADVHHAEAVGNPFPHKSLEELDTSMMTHWAAAKVVIVVRNDIHYTVIPSAGHWTRLFFMSIPSKCETDQRLLLDTDGLGFTTVALLLPLPSYISSKLRTSLQHQTSHASHWLNVWVRLKLEFIANDDFTAVSQGFTRQEQSPDERDAIKTWDPLRARDPVKALGWLGSEYPWAPEYLKLIRLLLENGADPNYVAPGMVYSTWQTLLAAMAFYLGYNPSLVCVKALLQLFESHGADMSAIIQIRCDPSEESERSPLYTWWFPTQCHHLNPDSKRNRWIHHHLSAASFIEFLCEKHENSTCYDRLVDGTFDPETAESTEEKDIELVMEQTSSSKFRSIKALVRNDNDIVNAIMEIIP